MPWYTNPLKTTKVLNRIATRYESSAIQDLRSALDNVTELVRIKLVRYYNGNKL